MDTILWREDLQLDPVDPDDNYLQPIDWSARLNGDSLAAAEVSATAGIVATLDSFTASITHIRLQTGSAGGFPEVSVKITTASGQVWQRSFIVPVREL